MPATKPVLSKDFWALLESWAKTRITPGILALPHGWGEWALDDFLAHAAVQGSGSDGLAPDLDLSSHAVRGDKRPMLVANGHHTDPPRLLFDIVAQSASDSAATYAASLARQRQRLADAPLASDGRETVPYLLAMTLGGGSAPPAPPFRLRFNATIGGNMVQAYSLRVPRGDGAGTTTTPQSDFDPLRPLPGLTAPATPAPLPSGKPGSSFANLFPPPPPTSR